MDGLQETVANKLTPSFDVLSGVAISCISGIIDKMGEIDGDALATKVSGFVDNASKYWSVFKADFIEVKNAFGDAVSAIVGDIGKLTGAFGATECLNSFSDVLGVATNALTTFTGFCEEHSETIAKVITILPKLYIAYKGFKIVKAVAPFVTSFSEGILMLAGKGIGAIAGKLFGIGVAEETVGNASMVSAKQMMQSAVAFLALGAGVALISAGFALLSYSAIQLAQAGPLASGVMLGMVVAVGALLEVAKSVASTLTAGAVGFIAFGAAVTLAGVGMMFMSNAAISLANAGPLAIGVMVGMVAIIAALAVGAAALGPALTVGAVGFVAFGAAIVLVGAGALLASAALSVVAGILPTVVQYGAQGAVSIAALGAGMLVFAVGVTMAGAGCVVLGAGLVVASAGLIVFAAGMSVASAGTLILSVALKAVNSSMKSIASNAKSAKNSISSMESSIDIVNSGLDALGNKAKSGVYKLVSAFSSGSGKAQSAASTMMKGFNSGISTGGNTAVATSRNITNSIVSSMKSASSGSYSCGVYIGKGLANGMRSTLGTVRSIAAQLAAAAEAAIRAKAKIHSPSKVTDDLGEDYGNGWIGGIKRKIKEAYKTAEELVSIPEVASPELAFVDSGVLSDEYDYSHNATFTIVVPLEIEGREVARATATYTQEELDKNEKLKNMMKGIKNV